MNGHGTTVTGGLAAVAMQWAARGRDRFVRELRVPEFKRLYTDRVSGEPVLLVYGRTQVGKTELILRLLGLDLGRPEHAELKSALRGGRQLGQSASATATVYRRHDHPGFSLRADGVDYRGLSATELRDHVASIRQRVEAGEWSADGPPVEIGLPHDLDRNEGFHAASLTILDLPGVGSSTEAEKPHLERLLRRYLPLASVVILVYPSMQLSRLGDVEAPELEDWECDTLRFRVVLTRAISPADIQRGLRGPIPWSMDDLRRYYATELRKSVPTFPDRLAVHPVEFGESWDAFRLAEPELHARMAPIVEEELRQLANGLPSPTPEQQLMALIRAHAFIEARAQKRSNQLRAVLAAAASTARSAAESVKTTEALEAACARRVSLVAAEHLELPPPSLRYGVLASTDEQDVGDFTSYLADVECKLLEDVGAYLSALFEAVPGVAAGTAASELFAKAEGVIEDALSSARARLASYTFDTYFWGWETEQEADRHACRAAAGRAADEAGKVIHGVRDATLAAWAADRSRRLQTARRDLEHQQRHLAMRRRAATESSEAERAASVRLAEWEQVATQDLSLAVDFRRYLLRALDDACAEWQRELLAPQKSATERISSCLSILVATHRATALDLLPREADEHR